MALNSLACFFLLSWITPISGFCPAGFGDQQAFPKEWAIPPWPTDMSMEDTLKLRTVTLGGFKKADLNEEYLEGPGATFKVQGRETYWQASGKYFMFYCQRFQKWRIAAISAFGQNSEGNCFAFVSDSHKSREIQDEALIKDWIEVENGEWIRKETAGVVELGTLGDQMEMEAEDEEIASTCAGEDGEGEDKSKCPVMPMVRKAKKKVVAAAKHAGAWVKRLFPKFLGAPDEEDAEPVDDDESPVDEEADGASDSCKPLSKDHEGCSHKQRFYIERQRNLTREGRQEELVRLDRMKDAVMKPAAKKWYMARVNILRKLTDHDFIKYGEL